MSSQDAVSRSLRSPRVVWGLEDIGKTINRSKTETRWLAKNKKIRVKWHGRRTCSAIVSELLADVAGSGEEPAA
jgi:hypothetical protein